MSTRTTLRPTAVLTNGDMSGNLTSLPTVLQGLSGVSYELDWTGTSPVGTASVQVSNTYQLNSVGGAQNAGTWTTIFLDVNGTPSETIAITGNTGNGFINITGLQGYACRLIYTAGSGVGSLNVVVNGKVS